MSSLYFFVSFLEFSPQALCDEQLRGLAIKLVILSFTLCVPHALFWKLLLGAALIYGGLHPPLRCVEAQDVGLLSTGDLRRPQIRTRLGICPPKVLIYNLMAE